MPTIWEYANQVAAGDTGSWLAATRRAAILLAPTHPVIALPRRIPVHQVLVQTTSLVVYGRTFGTSAPGHETAHRTPTGHNSRNDPTGNDTRHHTTGHDTCHHTASHDTTGHHTASHHTAANHDTTGHHTAANHDTASHDATGHHTTTGHDAGHHTAAGHVVSGPELAAWAAEHALPGPNAAPGDIEAAIRRLLDTVAGMLRAAGHQVPDPGPRSLHRHSPDPVIQQWHDLTDLDDSFPGPLLCLGVATMSDTFGPTLV
jgi:hypothetical protein